MPIHLKQNQLEEFQPAKAGTYAAICIDIVEAFNVASVYQGVESINDKITFVFWNAQNEQVWSDRFNNSSFVKSALAKFLTRWAGKELTQENLDRMDIEKCIGKTALVSVEHSVSKTNGKTYANVKIAVPLPEGMRAPQPDPEYVRRKDRPSAGQGEALKAHPNQPRVQPKPTAQAKIEQEIETGEVEDDSSLPF